MASGRLKIFFTAVALKTFSFFCPNVKFLFEFDIRFLVHPQYLLERFLLFKLFISHCKIFNTRDGGFDMASLGTLI